MKKIYYQILGLIVFSAANINAQYLIPFTGSNTIPNGTVTLCSHAGCGVTYGPSADGFSVIYPGLCGFATTVTGTYNTESCCDYVRIYNGIGIGGTQLASYQGTGTFTFVSTPNQTISVRFRSDGSVQNPGLQATVNTGPDVTVNNGLYNYTICTGESVPLMAEGMDTFTWSPFVLSSSVVVNPMTATIYTVTGEDTGTGCLISKTVDIAVNITPTISISGSTVICGPGNSTQLTANDHCQSSAINRLQCACNQHYGRLHRLRYLSGGIL
jgi:hypothetical protein